MPTVQCPNCRSSVDSNQTFCPECGTRITASLPSANEPTQMLPQPGQPSPTYPPPPGQYGQPSPTYPPPGQYGQQPGSYPPPPSGQYGQQPGYGGYPPPGGQAPKNKTPLIIGGVVGVLALGGIGYAISQGGGGGGSGTATTSSRATARPTAAATRPKPTTKPTAEPTPTEEPATGFGSLPGSSVIADDFSDKRERWPEDDVFVGDAYRYIDGAYQIQVDSDARILWTGTSTDEPYGDINARLDVSFVGGPDANAAGLTLREQAEGGMYVFQISPNGAYAFRRRDPNPGTDNEWTNVIDWTETEAIKPGLNEVNQIEIKAVGSSFTLIINGQEVDVAVDDTYTSGAVGFGASSFDEGGTLAQFDNFEVTEP